MEYYAFALDSVAWASPSLQAPATMTLDQLQKVYNCTYTDWSQVGGGAGPIQRYMPQNGSGTNTFFIQTLGFEPRRTISTCSAVIDTQLDNGGLPLEENHGDHLDAAGYQKAILPYSGGQWAFQANLSINPTLDHRGGAREGDFIATRSAATIATTNGSTTITGPANNTFFGLDTGASVTGPGIPANTKVVSVAANGSSAVISNAATATASVSLTIVDLSSNVVGWNASGGLWQPNTPSVANPRGPVSEAFVTLNSPTPAYPAIRYVYNVLDTPLPGYGEARNLVGVQQRGGRRQVAAVQRFELQRHPVLRFRPVAVDEPVRGRPEPQPRRRDLQEIHALRLTNLRPPRT